MTAPDLGPGERFRRWFTGPAGPGTVTLIGAAWTSASVFGVIDVSVRHAWDPERISWIGLGFLVGFVCLAGGIVGYLRRRKL